jgi:hypothetical protein
MFNHEETVQQLERHCRYSKKIERYDRLAVIVKKSEPALARIAAPQNLSQIPSHTSFGDAEAEFLEFTVDLRRSPVRVLIRQTSDEYASLLRDLWSAASRPGTPAPVKAEACAVPADHGRGLDDNEDVGPAGPEPAKGSPE